MTCREEVSSVEKYYRQNREKLHRLMRHSDPVIASMAAAIVRIGGEDGDD